MEMTDAITSLKALAHETRLALYRQLVQACPAGLAVGALAAALRVPDSTLSAHLNVLRAAGLVLDAREGRVIRCRADYARMEVLLDYLSENCCAGATGCAQTPRCSPSAAKRQSRTAVRPRTPARNAGKRSP